jgi:hypothetical protein
MQAESVAAVMALCCSMRPWMTRGLLFAGSDMAEEAEILDSFPVHIVEKRFGSDFQYLARIEIGV